MSNASHHTGENRQGGFALLVSLIAIVGLTALATGGFLLANSERRVSTNHHDVVEAFYLANAGLNDYLANQKGTPPPGPTAYGPYGYAAGSASVTVRQVSTAGGAGDAPIYVVESEGRYDPNDTGDPVTRTVRTVSLLDLAVLPTPPAAITSGGGARKNGASGLISGQDECGVDGDRPAIRVPEDEGFEGKDDALEGSDPPVDSVADPFDFIPDGESWWNGLRDGTTVPHDYTVDSDNNSFPDLEGESDMPVTYIDQDSYELGKNESGKGLLIVRGNATLKGNFEWDGMILVGGSLTDNGQGQVRGGVMTGLNVLRGEDVSADDLADTDRLDGTKKYLFNSCIVDQVQSSSAILAELPGTWHERI